MTQRQTRWVQRETWSLRCKGSRDVAFAGACGVLTTLATSLESLHLLFHVPHFTQLVSLFVVLGAPPYTGQPPPCGGSWAQIQVLSVVRSTDLGNLYIV